MNSFLRDVAYSLHRQYGQQLTEIDVVFASRRASRYFFKELSALDSVRPKCYSMDVWIEQLSDNVSIESRFVLISKLFSIYSNYYPDETFEQFYSFGNLLISDFDMIDRYMVDARTLYSIVSDTRDVEILTDDALRDSAIAFWSAFDATNAKRHKQQEFIRVWRSLYDIYRDFTELIDEQKISYSGRVYRKVAEEFDSSTYNRRTIFVGLNALSKSEKQILSKLNKSGLADFIWDYDQKWLDDRNSECGYFISHNIKLFEQATYFDTSINQPQQVDIEVIESPSDAAQCKLLPALLEEISAKVTKLDERVAIILTDENLLTPLLYSLPKTIEKLNISMGYPLRATLACRLVELLVKLQRRSRREKFYLHDVTALIDHPYFADIQFVNKDKTYLSIEDLPDDLAIFWRHSIANYRSLHAYLKDALSSVEQKVSDEKELLFITKTIEALDAVGVMVAQCDEEISISLYLSLLDDVIKEQSIEFEGVSGSGLQIMGILESRTLDFDYVVMLSMNDDNFPSSRSDSSYIPQLLLQGYGMPTVAEKSAIWSYYFYRLLQRSTEVKLLYCSVSDGMTTGEQSRYISQLEYSSPFVVNRKKVTLDIVPTVDANKIEVAKTNEMIVKADKLCYYPTMFSTYLTCPLSFYFNSVECIEKPRIDDEQISSIDVGNLLHKTIYELYSDFKGKPEVVQLISKIKTQSINEVIDRIMHNVLGEKIQTQPSMASITRLTLYRMIRAIVDYDSHRDDLFCIEMLEEKINGEIAGVKFAGVIDRVDRLRDGSISILDYKTGTVKTEIGSIEQLFDQNEPLLRNSIITQILIYSVLARQKWKVDISPAIYAARKMGNTNGGFSPMISIAKEPIMKLQVEHYQQIEKSIENVFCHLRDLSQPFVQTENVKSCQYCPYSTICRR